MQIPKNTLDKLVETQSLAETTSEHIYELVANEEALQKYIPDGYAKTDPRDGAVILYNSARARRPHGYSETEISEAEASKSCPVCEGKTTGILDVAELSEGYTFINKNLFPLMYPADSKQYKTPDDSFYTGEDPKGAAASGIHLLQWSSSFHDKDWHNMPIEDCTTVMQRLAELEKKLLTGTGTDMPETGQNKNGNKVYGYVSIIKNHGKLVGGSMPHGHQQIAHGNVKPKRVSENEQFEERNKDNFSASIQKNISSDLIVKDYDTATLFVPPFMRRPFASMLALKDTSKSFLHDLSQKEIKDIAQAWSETTRAILTIMPRIGREPAYNIITNNGPGTGLYFEFLPYTQEMGGYEHLGLWICQGTPEQAAGELREIMK